MESMKVHSRIEFQSFKLENAEAVVKSNMDNYVAMVVDGMGGENSRVFLEGQRGNPKLAVEYIWKYGEHRRSTVAMYTYDKKKKGTPKSTGS